ncbi:MAG TPA: hypothetical protein VM345_19325 [Acidimicrobiales bacterium]|nr:hypothetical protein [Acidimicrobiales bacterium]
MEAGPDDVHRRLRKLRRQQRDERRHAAVRSDHVPLPVDDERRVRLHPAQDDVDRVPHRFEVGLVERPLAKGRREARGDEEGVAVAQGDVELFGQVQHELAAGLRPPGLDEAQVPRRDAGLHAEVELAHPPLGTPPPQQVADGRGVGRTAGVDARQRHGPNVPSGRSGDDYLAGNRIDDVARAR